MNLLAPFGHSNPKPVYRFNELEVVKCYPVGHRHTRGLLRNRKQGQIEFIAFNMLPQEFTGKMLDVLATPQLNNYYSVNRPQLNIIDVQNSY